jgi:hypothetical protein
VRILLAILIAMSLTLVVVGSLAPGLFVLALLGLLVLTGTAAIGVAALMQHPGPHAHY